MKKMLFLALFSMLYGAANLNGQVTIGVDEEPSQWSLLDLKEATDGTSSKAFHLPRLTASGRDALTASVKDLTKGLLIYNTTTNCLEYWNLQKWISLCAGQANITFTDPGGTPAGDITQPPFPYAGEVRGSYVPHDEPECAGKDPAYSFLVTSGDDYTDIIVENSATGQFSLSMNANETAVPRHAIVRVINNCTAEYKEFVFTQDGDVSSCGVTSTIPDIMSENSLDLCMGGAVYLYLDGYPSGTYIWTLGEVEKGRGASYIATVPGIYKVYADKIGCPNVPPKTVTVTSGQTGAPSPVSIIVGQNNGFVCDLGHTTRLFASATGAGTIVWYKDGAKTNQTGSNIDAGIGVWFAVVEDGSCSSTPSNTVSVSLDPHSGLAIPTPTFTINGIAPTAGIDLCSGGTLVLDVTNAQTGVTYTWLMDDVEIGSGTHYEKSLAGVTSGFVLQCRATGAQCSSAGVEVVNITVGNAPSQPNITVNTPGDAICDGAATLVANVGEAPDSYIWYRSDTQNGTYSIVQGETGQTFVITQEGWFKVAAKKGNCVSELSGAKGVTVSSGAATATISGDQTNINPGDTRTYTATMNNPQGASYSWTITGNANPTPTSGTGSSIAVRFSNAGNATINLTAQNACGTATVTNNNYPVTVSPLCTPPGVSSYSPSGRTVTVTQGNITGNLSITASGSPTLSYQWYSNTQNLNTGGTPVNGEIATTFAIPTGLTYRSDPYYYYCEVTSDCGTPATTVKSEVFAVTVNPNPSTLPAAGSGTLSGKTCFDVAINEGGAECGSLVSRNSEKSDFSQSAVAKQTYTFTPSGTVADVRFYVVEAAAFTGQIVQNVSYSGNTATVTYKNVNSIAAGRTRNNPLKVTVYVVFVSGGVDVQLSLSVNIMDCHCCPGYFAQGGEYTAAAGVLNIPANTTFNTLITANQPWKFTKTGKSLCYYKTDAAGKPSWGGAKTACSTAGSGNGNSTGWRLTNLAELGAVDAIAGTMSSQSSSAIGTANFRTDDGYHSINEAPPSGSRVKNHEWKFSSHNTGNNYDNYNKYVRCVRSY